MWIRFDKLMQYSGDTNLGLFTQLQRRCSHLKTKLEHPHLDSGDGSDSELSEIKS